MGLNWQIGKLANRLVWQLLICELPYAPGKEYLPGPVGTCQEQRLVSLPPDLSGACLLSEPPGVATMNKSIEVLGVICICIVSEPF